MFSALVGLFSGLIGLLTFLAPVIVIVYLLISDNKKKKANANTVVVATAQVEQNAPVTVVNPAPVNAAPPAPPKAVDPYKKWNILLYLGSFLLVLAMVVFIGTTDDELVAPTAITLTLLFYIGGIALYKTVPYLQSVGKSFAYTASAVFPFWVIAFTSFGLEMQPSWIITSVVSLVVFIADSLIFNSKITATFAYIWLFVLTWSCTPGTNDTVVTYWTTLAPMTLTLVPASLWLGKPKWLPVAFRKPTQVLDCILTPIFALALSVSFFIEDFAMDFPFLRTAFVAILLIYALLHWFKEHKYGFFVFFRLVAQLLVFTIVTDVLNYSVFEYLSYFSSYSFKSKETIVLSVTVVWLVGFLAQSLTALFIPKKDKTAVVAEHIVEVISLIGILAAPVLALGVESAEVIQLLILLFVAILGIAYAIVHKNILWTIATLVGLLMAPTALSDIFDFNSMEWFLVAYFSIYGLLALLGYTAFRKKQPSHSFVLTLIEIIIAGFVVIAASADTNFVEVGWLILAVLLTLFGYLSNKVWLYELAIYSGALCIFSLVGTVGGAIAETNKPATIHSNCSNGVYSRSRCLTMTTRTSFEENAELTISTVRAFVMPIALFAVSWWKERKEDRVTKKWRFLSGYILLSLCLLVIGWSGGGYWMLPSLITQVAFLVYSVFKDRSWMVWTTISILAISMISLSGGYVYIWFGVIGIVLILIVVWRLTKLNAQKQREDAKQMIAETNKEDSPKEDAPKEENRESSEEEE